ncbi:MAG: phosphatidylserine decarboxylase, partial [Mesosutterella sp.]|nr:phosphatidylserine decarboxylase [Mesosutterella sp.]
MDQRIYPHPFIAKEGWPFIAGTGLVALVVTALDWDFLSLICWALFVLVLQFFRDPAREIPQGEKLVLSVVDGRVLKVEKAVDPYTGQVSLLISVFMNLFNVHSQRFPVNGTVLKKVYRPGKYFNASLDKASAENEQCGLVVRASDGNQLTFVQIAGLVTHRILNYV